MNITVLSSGSEKGNSYWVSDSHTHLLLDCGISRKKIADLLREKGNLTVDAVLCTHCHADHSKGVKDLLRLGVDVYMSKGTAEALGVEGRVHIIGAYGWEDIGSFRVFPFEVEHDAPEPLGFRLVSQHTGEALLYATDTMWVNPRLGDGCTALLLEANYSLPILKGKAASGEVDRLRKHRTIWNHQSIDTVLKFLRETDRSRLEAVVLLHLSSENSDEQAFKQAVAEICGCRVVVA